MALFLRELPLSLRMEEICGPTLELLVAGGSDSVLDGLEVLGVSTTGARPDPDSRGCRDDLLSAGGFSAVDRALRKSFVGEEGLVGVVGEVGDFSSSCCTDRKVETYLQLKA